MKRLGLATLMLVPLATACREEPITPAPTCSLPTEDPVVVAMGAGWDVTLAVMSDGSLWCWGSDFEGQCQSGFLPYPLPIVEGECLTTIASSNTAATSILDSGAARLWWLDSRDIELNDPYLTNREVLGTIVQTEAYLGSVALMNDQGVVFLVGHAGAPTGGRDFDDFEVADLPVEVEKLAPGLTPCLLGVNGVAYCLEVDENGVPQDADEQGADVSSFKPLSVPEAVQSFSVGAEQACALVDSGAVYCVGAYVTPPLPTGEPTTSFELVEGLPPLGVLKLSELGGTACGLSNGQLWCWGANTYDLYEPEDDDLFTPVQSGDFGNVVDFAVGDFHLCALLDNHEVWCRGYGSAKGLCTVETDWEKLSFEYCNAFD
jgi:hypothetical protein